MQFGRLAQIAALMGAATAAPSPAAGSAEAPFNFDDVILLSRDGNHQLVKESEYQVLAERGGLEFGAPEVISAEKRWNAEKRCDESEEIQVKSDQTFLNWDVPISPLVSAAGGGVSVAVASGYTIANTVTATAGMNAAVSKVLTLTMSVSYAYSWTTTETQTLTYTVPEGNYGLIVSQPKVRRVTGNYIYGCTDEPKTSSFQSDTYTSQSWGNLDWVTGVIRLCNSTEYPVPYCIGTGTHS